MRPIDKSAAKLRHGVDENIDTKTIGYLHGNDGLRVETSDIESLSGHSGRSNRLKTAGERAARTAEALEGSDAQTAAADAPMADQANLPVITAGAFAGAPQPRSMLGGLAGGLGEKPFSGLETKSTDSAPSSTDETEPATPKDSANLENKELSEMLGWDTVVEKHKSGSPTEVLPDDPSGRDSPDSASHSSGTDGDLADAFVDYERTQLGLAEDANDQDVLSAYFKADLEANTPARRLEEDADLMEHLAKASGFYASDIEADELTAGQKRQLTRELMLSLTADIDWDTALGQDKDDPTAVWCDGWTLRNATDISIGEAAEALETRIEETLLDSPAYQNETYLTHHLRRVLTDDPTLSLDPLPDDIEYGSADWARIRIGMEGAQEFSDLSKFETSDFEKIGRLAMALELGEPANSAATTPAWASTASILLMAQAAGKLDGVESTAENFDVVAQKLTEFIQEKFKLELDIIEGIANFASAGEVPRREAFAEKAIEELQTTPTDIDITSEDFDIDEAASYLNSYEDSYSSGFEDESDAKEAIDKLQSSTTDIEMTKDDIAEADAYLNKYKHNDSEFEAAVAAYKEKVANGAALFITSAIQLYERNKGHDWKSANITVSQLYLDSKTSLQGTAPVCMSFESPAFVVTVKNQGLTKRFILFTGHSGEQPGFMKEIPVFDPVADDDLFRGWMDQEQNQRAFFTSNQRAEYKKDQNTYGDTPYVSAKHTHNYRVEDIGSGSVAELKAEIYAHYSSIIDEKSEIREPRLVDFIVGAIPIAGTIKSFMQHDVSGGIFSAILDTIGFIPFLGQAMKLVGTTAKLTRSILTSSLKSSFSASLRESAGLMRPVSMGLAETGQAFLAGANPIPFIDPPSVLGALKSDLAATIRQSFPDLAAKIDGSLSSGARVIEDGEWSIKTEATASDGAESLDEITEIKYVAAKNAQGESIQLTPYGDAFARFHGTDKTLTGPIMLQDRVNPLSDGSYRLYASISVEDAAKFRISDDESLLTELVRATPLDDGTLQVRNESYAKICKGVYVKVVKDAATSTPEKPIWRVLDPATPGAPRDQRAPRLYYDPNTGLWRRVGKNDGTLSGGQGASVLTTTLRNKTVLITDMAKGGTASTAEMNSLGSDITRLNEEKNGYLTFEEVAGRPNALRPRFIPKSKGKPYKNALEFDWIPYKPGIENVGYVDIELTNPARSFVFTPAMNGCSLIVTKIPNELNKVRVWHFQKNQEFDHRGEFLRRNGLTEDDVIDEFGPTEYFGEGGLKNEHTMTAVAFNGLFYQNGEWNFFSQGQYQTITEKGGFWTAKPPRFRPMNRKSSGLIAQEIETRRVKRPNDSLTVLPGAPPVKYQGKSYIIVKSMLFEVKPGETRYTCSIVDPNNPEAKPIPMWSDGEAWYRVKSVDIGDLSDSKTSNSSSGEDESELLVTAQINLAGGGLL